MSPRLSPIKMASGHIERMLIEQCRAYCKDCDKVVSEWLDYDEAMSEYIDHRRKVHHNDNLT